MTEKQYQKQRERILKYYEKIEKSYIKTQAHSIMFESLQHEKNDRLLELTERFHHPELFSSWNGRKLTE